MTKQPTPENREEIRRLLMEIRGDLAELRSIFERIHARRGTRPS
jgi:hypothetical protein